jgi:Zn-dependent metalloprotease
MSKRNPIRCIIPPYITEYLAQSPNPEVRSRAIAELQAAVAMRTTREIAQAMPSLMAVMSPYRRKHRLVYDAQQTDQLPGSLARSEGQAKVADAVVNEVYDAAGDVYDFFEQVFQRNSLDGHGMSLIATVHFATVDASGRFIPLSNAFWNGRQMVYGDGDGIVYQRFTRSLEVVGHEMTHCLQSFTSNLNYTGQSGSLNEHFADVFGMLVRQWKNGEKAEQASWVVGADLLVPSATRRGVRDMAQPGTAYANDADLGKDPQPDHMSNFYTGKLDRGGVQINSGIPNRAFYLTAVAIGGNAWEVAGRIWYDVLMRIPPTSQFQDCAKLTVEEATGHGATAKKAVKAAWKKVGITV